MADTIYQGEYLTIDYTVMDRSVEPAVPADLTGLDITAYLGWKHEPQLLVLGIGSGITLTDAANGALTLTLTSTQTELPPRVYELELWAEDAGRFELLDRLPIEVRDSWRVT